MFRTGIVKEGRREGVFRTGIVNGRRKGVCSEQVSEGKNERGVFKTEIGN